MIAAFKTEGMWPPVVNLRDGFEDSTGLGATIGEHAPRIAGLEVHAGGYAFAPFEPPETEFIGLAFAIVILILIAAFGSVLAMGLPVAVALGGVGIGVAAITVLSNVIDVPDFTSFLGVMIGLGVGVDYALFIVTRYRGELHQGRTPRDATIVALSSTGHAITLAGLTVMASLGGLFVVGIGWVAGMAAGIAATVAATLITSLTLLPALLGVIGARIETTRWRGLIAAAFVAVALLGLGVNQGGIAALGGALAALTLVVSLGIRPLRAAVPRRAARPIERTLAYRWSTSIGRRPREVVAGTGLLAMLAVPVFSLRLGKTDEGNSPKNTSTRLAYDLLADGFGAGFNGPLTIAAVPRVAGPGPAWLDRIIPGSNIPTPSPVPFPIPSPGRATR